MTMRTGGLHAFEWIDFTFIDFPDKMLTPATRGRTGAVRIVSPKGQGPSQHTISQWMVKDPYFGSYFAPGVGFRPFDEAAEFPGVPVTYYKGGFSEFKADEWAGEVLDIPENVEVTFSYERWKQKLYAYARTMKDGAETLVRRKVGTDDVFTAEMAKILGYFERNCPRIEEGAQKALICGTHVNAVLAHMAGEGWRHVDRWLTCARDAPIDRATGITIPGAMLTRVEGAVKASLRRNERSGVVQMDIELEGGHRLSDDEQGTTVRLKAQLPNAVVAALKGRGVHEAIDLPWLRGLTIRTARIEDGDVVIRAFAKRGPVALPVQTEDDDATIRDQLHLVTSGKQGLTSYDESIRPLLEGMSARTLLAVLAMLQATDRMALDDHGHPGWTVRKMGNMIQMESCPTTDIGDLVESALRRM